MRWNTVGTLKNVVMCSRATRSSKTAASVEAVMITEVVTCQPDDDLQQLARRMTDTRCRHLPVVVDGELVGIVSIGDVVKARLTQLEEESRQMQDYITTGR